ncbi:MAG TPA: TetR/AcrR family transcriptional regulator [Hydrogenophaga sp.]
MQKRPDPHPKPNPPRRNPAAPPDRRVRKTREALRDALLGLLPEVGWDGLDVAMLCQRADVGRSTFYLHYPDKAALLKGAFEDLQAHLLGSLNAESAEAPYPFLPGLLAHVHEQQQVFRALLGRRSGQVVQQHFRELLYRLFARSTGGRRLSSLEAARAQMLAGSLFQLLVWWLGAGPADTRRQPAEVQALFLAFSVSAVPP